MQSKPVQIYKGQAFTRSTPMMPKIITFDLDETLGSFGDLYVLWEILVPWIPPSIPPATLFRELLTIFPEFLRPGILPILQYLHQQKKGGHCSRIFLYTNNQCPSADWINRILFYFHETCPDLFDQAICAFKIGDQRIEPLRTTHSKTYNDLIRCSLLPKNAEFCFVDNSYHPKMIHERVYYIQPRSYQHGLSGLQIMDRFMTKWKLFPLPDTFELPFGNRHSIQGSTGSRIVSQKIMYYLKEYFMLSVRTQKTKKIKWNLGRFTRKKR